MLVQESLQIPPPSGTGHSWCLHAQGGVIHFSDHPLVRVTGEAPGQGAQKRESETLNDRFPSRLLHSLNKQSGCPSLFPELPSPPPHLRHFHLCSLGPSEEYEMATRQQGYIRSPWFFKSHSKSKSSSHRSPSSEVKMKGNWMPLPNMCPSAFESEMFIYSTISTKLPSWKVSLIISKRTSRLLLTSRL